MSGTEDINGGFITIHQDDLPIWHDMIEDGNVKEVYRCWNDLAPGILDTEAEG